jgi:anti-sigma B factor antagonist
MFNVDLSTRYIGGQPVVGLSGKLDLADTPAAATHLTTAVAACGPSVIVDLAALESIGYSGLAVLVRVLKWTRGSGGDLSLAAPQQQVRRILEATGLIDVFPVYPSVEQAANSARLARARPSAVWQRPSPARITLSRGRRPWDRAACHPSARPLPRHQTCRPRHIVRDACRKRRPGTTTALAVTRLPQQARGAAAASAVLAAWGLLLARPGP